jgi:ribosome-binding ATPase
MKRVGILGLPQSGKTTLFEILMQGAGHAATAGRGAARDLVGVVRVPDARVDKLAALYQPKKTTYAQIQFAESGAARGEVGAGAGAGDRPARGTDLFAAVRNCDAVLAVVRDFAAPGPADPARDLATLETELALSDLAIVEGRLDKLAREIRVGKKEGEREHALLGRCRMRLEAGVPLRAESFAPEDHKLLRGFQLLSLKPLLAVYNQDEASHRVPAAAGPNALAVALRAHLEREIVALPAEERDRFRAELGAGEDGLTLVIRSCYELLGLISFFTVGPDEVRAWTLRRGDHAVDAAAEIHTDLARGFIRAEVVPWERLLEAGSVAKAREKAWARLEGREYVVADGDCIEIRFNK